jgi:hypothetical protein
LAEGNRARQKQDCDAVQVVAGIVHQFDFGDCRYRILMEGNIQARGDTRLDSNNSRSCVLADRLWFTHLLETSPKSEDQHCATTQSHLSTEVLDRTNAILAIEDDYR